MKNIARILAAVLLLSMLLTACKPSDIDTTGPKQMDTPSSSSQTNADPEPTPSSTPDDPEPELPVYVPGSIILEDQDGDDYPFERKYRIAYYRIYGNFTQMLTKEEKNRYEEWFFEFSEEVGTPQEIDEMKMVSYIKEFNITREEFDAAVESFIALHGEYTQFEEFEIPNADIIYTFDNEIINEYYRYE